jgi:flavin-dependent dehydrogenase
MQGSPVADVQLKESSVVIELEDGRQQESRLLLLASGRGTGLIERVGLLWGSGGSAVWSALVDNTLTTDAAPANPNVSVILGLDTAGSFGLCSVSPSWMSVSVSMTGEREEVIPALLHVCRQAFEHDIVPADLSDQARSADILRSPASVALDMDSHVGKNALVIGDAGGFVSAASNEGVYPAMWSAQLAVEVAQNALESKCPQDELMTFDSTWRMQMADYLRSPHTDIQFLLPLIFTNQPMADRMGAAFFHGENI